MLLTHLEKRMEALQRVKLAGYAVVIVGAGGGARLSASGEAAKRYLYEKQGVKSLICWTGIKSGWRESNIASRYVLQIWREVSLSPSSHHEIGERSVVRRLFGRIVYVFDASAKTQDQIASHRWILPFKGRLHIYHSDSDPFRIIALLIWKDHIPDIDSSFRIVAYPRSRGRCISGFQLRENADVLGGRMAIVPQRECDGEQES